MVIWKNIVETIKSETNGRKILLAVSGGVDSMLLLYLTSYYSLPVSVAHFQHLMREDDYKDCDLVREFCDNADIPFYHGKAVTDLKNENDARIARWGFLENIADRTGAGFIATGHHQNDQIENFILRMMRGADAESLMMYPKSEINGIVRYKPFLAVPKNEIIGYARKHGVNFNHDITNDDTKHDRNWIRNVILPEMQKRRNVMKAIPKTINSIHKLASDTKKAPE